MADCTLLSSNRSWSSEHLGLLVRLLERGNELPLCNGQLGVGLFTANVTLVNAAAGGEPIPYGDIESCRRGVTEIPSAVWRVDSELRRIDSVAVVKDEVGKEGPFCRAYRVLGRA